MGQSTMSRRDFVKTASAVSLAASLPALGIAGASTSTAKIVGEWSDDSAGLPRYTYTANVPFALPKNWIPRDYLPEDPFFLLGNYRFTLFAHVSGIFEILSGERAWGRLNQGPEMWSGANRASVTVNGTVIPLIGLTEPVAQSAEKFFGVGYAQFRYQPTPDLRVTRTLSVLPSSRAGEGTSAFVVSVVLQNLGKKPLQVAYQESVKAAYKQAFAKWDQERDLIQTSRTVTKDSQVVRCDFHAKEPRPLTFSQGKRMSRFEGAPPSLFVRIPSGHEAETSTLAEKDSEGGDWIGVQTTLSLAASEEKVFHYIIGYAFKPAEINKIADTLTHSIGNAHGPLFQSEWSRVVPKFADEQDAELRREMRWNAAVLEQMATWREYYDETVVPQGTVYDYQWGVMASSRDLAQQALPLCHLNPALARSTLRFIMKRTIPDGEIKLDDTGFGWAPHSGRLTSDQQLYFFQLLNEYLRATGDASILTESVSYYPLEQAGAGSGLDHVRAAFLFLRDRIGTGQHGLVKLWNSDWNDMFFFWPISEPYNYVFEFSESHMNTAMAIAILGDLSAMLRHYDHSEGSAELLSAVGQYRGQLLKAYLADWGDRPFPRRMYFQYKAVGEDEMWLEPQGFTLLIPELSAERKKALFTEIKTRLIKSEAVGMRQIEKPIARAGTKAGAREDGGFWYALSGPVVLGVASFDKDAAMDLLRRLTFAHFARKYPTYWTGQWSASDSLDSSALLTDGLSEFMIYCAHPHAWPLYCYLRLREGSGNTIPKRR